MAVQANYKIIEEKIFAKRFGEDYVELPSVENNDPIIYYQEQFSKFNRQADVVFEKIDATENKGSYLVKISTLSEGIKLLVGIGDFDGLQAKIEFHKTQLSESVEGNRKRNLEIKMALIASLAQIVNENNWRATEEVKELQQKWIRVGKAGEPEDSTLTAQYLALKDTFFEQKKDFFDSQKELVESRTQYYREIIQQIEQLSEAKEYKANRPKIDALIEDWKQNGAIPKSSYDSLFLLYKKTLDNYFERLKKDKKQGVASADTNKVILQKKQEVLKQLLDFKENNTRFEIKKIHHFKDLWNQAGKVHGKVLGKMGDEFYQTIEYLYEFSNLQNFQDKKGFGHDKPSLVKTLKRFINENEEEIKQFKENQEQMNIKLSSDAISTLFNKRLVDLEKKLAAKKRVLSSLE